MGNVRQDIKEVLSERFYCSGQKADELIREYRRFLYLFIVSAQGAVLPSDVIHDLLRMHQGVAGEWQRFGQAVTGRALDRWINDEPGQGRAYRRTKRLYAAEFGQKPPHQYWPIPGIATKVLVAGMVAPIVMLYAVYWFGPGYYWLFLPMMIGVFALVPFSGLLQPFKLTRSSRRGGDSGFVGGIDGLQVPSHSARRDDDRLFADIGDADGGGSGFDGGSSDGGGGDGGGGGD
ncbi:hypothetical protein [Paracoccus sp. (in: a-proteobacteria)]|uniref:hypothetical protein n=1 Tax=Paracoccus sp. TaxID=267 RepID=UPI003A8BFC7A